MPDRVLRRALRREGKVFCRALVVGIVLFFFVAPVLRAIFG